MINTKNKYLNITGYLFIIGYKTNTIRKPGITRKNRPALGNKINNQNNNNTTPFHFDFNQHFGNLWSAGQIPNNQLWNQNINLSPSQLKKSLEKSYKLTPISISAKLKNISSQNNSDNSYFTNRGSTDKVYKILADNTVYDGEYVFVGYLFVSKLSSSHFCDCIR